MEIRRFWSGLLATCLLVFGVAVGLSAQSFQGGVRGVVKDAQGVIPGVTVTLTNEQNNTTRETVTNGVGEYSFPAVDPSTYSIKAVVQGYKTFERKGVRVGTQQFAAIDIGLELGAIEETITVTAEAPLLETANASTGDVLDTKSLESIPTPGRSVFLMANLQPTVQSSGNAHWNRMQDQVGNSAVSMGGGAVRANQFLVDGFPVTDLQNRASTNPTIEAIQDMKVQVHTYDSEMGRTGGGVMNMTAKSGANAFHGSAYTRLPPRSVGPATTDPEAAGAAERAGVLAQRRRWRRRSDRQEQDVLLDRRREIRRQPAAAEHVPRADGGRVGRKLQRRDAQRHRQVIIKDPLTGQPFAQQSDSRQPPEPDRARACQLLAACRHARSTTASRISA